MVLGAAIALSAVLASRFGGAHPAPSAVVQVAGSGVTAAPSAAARESDGLPSAAYGMSWQSPAPTPPVAVPSPTVLSSLAGTSTPKASASPAGTGTGPGTGAPRPGTSTSGAVDPKGARCAPADIVLSLFTSQPSYGPGARPRFEVYAVSTATAPCELTYGPGSVRVVVTRHGQVVWDSATCRPAAAPTVRFSLGVPRLLAISWNRAAKSPAGCSGTLPAGASGTFRVVAMGGGRSSAIRSFTLSR